MTTAFPSQRLKIRFLPAVPGTDSKGSAIAAKFWFDQAKIQADIALQANITKVDKAGSVMTGPLTLFGDPTSPLVASTKQYTDTKVAKTGDSMSGFLTLSGDPIATLHAATKSYADTKVAKAGDTMTGTLVLSGPPVGPSDAATKQYVDGAVSTIGGGIFQPLDPDLSSIASNTTSATWLFRRGNGDWAPVVIGDGLSFDTVNGQLESVGGGGGGGTGDVSASDGPLANQLAMWIGSVTIKGINIGTGLALQTVGSTQSLVATTLPVQDGDKGDIVVSGTGSVWTIDSNAVTTGKIADAAVTYAKMQDATGPSRLLGRGSSGAGDLEEITVGAGLSMAGTTLAATGSISVVPTPLVGQTAQWTGPASLKGVQVHTAAPTVPSSPVPGNFWYDTSTGVLAVNVDDGNSQQWIQVAPAAGNLASNEAFVKTRTFTSNNLYIPTPGTQFIQVECIGGGGGGAAAGSNNVDTYQGGGGGGGGYSRSVLTAAQIGGSQSIIVGAGGTAVSSNGNPGGTTSFGGLVIANGGGGGVAGSAGSIPGGGPGGAPGTGDVAISGNGGGWGYYNPTDRPSILAYSGNGAPGPLGGGARAPTLGAPGIAANGYGGGGSGGAAHQASNTILGGAGSPGVVIITEYNIGVGQQGPQGLAGGVTTPLTPQGRLTLVSGSPVMTTSQPNKTTLFYSPYCGNQIPIWSGSSWTTMSFNELSAVTTDTTKSPAAIGITKCNDWFVWNDAGVLRLGHGPDWASDVGRALPIGRINGIWVNGAAITNGAPVNQGTYVGTTRSSASSQLEWIFGGPGTISSFAVWNAYNRVEVHSVAWDATATWTYAGSAVRPSNGSLAAAHKFLSGLPEDGITFTHSQRRYGTGFSWIGISQLSASTTEVAVAFAIGTAVGITSTAMYSFLPQTGYFYCTGTERCDGTNAATFSGSSEQQFVILWRA